MKDVRSIPRMVLDHVDDVEANLRGEVLRQAADNFGYCAESFGATGPLAKALRELGIAPLDTAHVERYKKSREHVRMVNRRAWAHWLLSVVPVSVALPLNIVFWNNTVGPLPTMGVALLSVIANGVLAIGFDRALTSRKHTWAWATYVLGPRTGDAMMDMYGRTIHRSVSRHTRYVPVHELHLANQIRVACPQVQFGMDELTYSLEDMPRPLPDLFLWTQLAGEKYYIAVWDEREFEARQ